MTRVESLQCDRHTVEDEPEVESGRARGFGVNTPPDEQLVLVLSRLMIALCSLAREIEIVRGASRSLQGWHVSGQQLLALHQTRLGLRGSRLY